MPLAGDTPTKPDGSDCVSRRSCGGFPVASGILVAWLPMALPAGLAGLALERVAGRQPAGATNAPAARLLRRGVTGGGAAPPRPPGTGAGVGDARDVRWGRGWWQGGA